jgi:TolA-binding protein
MGRGRPPLGAELVNTLDGSELAKQRLKVVLQTISGELTIPQACERLQLSEARFHELRSACLQTACATFEPKAVGRPASAPPTEQGQKIENLERQIAELKIDLQASQIRERMALLMPDVMVRPDEREEDRRERLDVMQKEWERLEAEKKSPTPSEPSSGTVNSTPKNSGKSGKCSA